MPLELCNIRYQYSNKEDFLLSLSTRVLTNQVTTLIGANGSGKSTTLKIITGQYIAFSGTYEIDGVSQFNRTGDLLYTHRIGYAPEEVLLDGYLTGEDITLLLKEIRAVSDDEYQEQMSYFRKMLNIEEWFSQKKCAQYSMGMRKKTALVIAFLGYPQFLILDEPTNGLDPLAVFGLKQMILKKREQGVGTLLSSHILDFVEKLADHVLVIKAGKLTFDGSLGLLHEQWPDKSLDEIYFTLYNGLEDNLVSAVR